MKKYIAKLSLSLSITHTNFFALCVPKVITSEKLVPNYVFLVKKISEMNFNLILTTHFNLAGQRIDNIKGNILTSSFNYQQSDRKADLNQLLG